MLSTHSKLQISTLPSDTLSILDSLLDKHINLYITDNFDDIFSNGDFPLITNDIVNVYGNWAIDKITTHTRQGKYIVYFSPLEGTTRIDFLNMFPDDVKKNFLMISPATFDNYLFKEYININYYLDITVSSWNTLCSLRHFDAVTEQRDRPYTFLMLNKRNRYHRTYLIDKLLKNSSLDRALWSYIDHGVMLPSRIPDYLNGLKHNTIDSLTNNEYQCLWKDGTINSDLYLNTYFSVITECNYLYVEQYFTEKIFKPILMGHPFIVVANKHYYKFLHNNGFKTFNTIVDESFDNIDDNDTRFDRIADIILDLSKSNLNEFLQKAKPICEYNRELLLEKKGKFPLTTHNNLVDFFDRLNKLKTI